MKKPIMVSLAGWLFLVLMTLATCNGIAGSFSPDKSPPMSAFATGLCILAALPSLMVWLFGTMLFAIQRRRAAYVQQQIQVRASKLTAERLESFPPSLDRVAASARTERR